SRRPRFPGDHRATRRCLPALVVTTLCHGGRAATGAIVVPTATRDEVGAMTESHDVPRRYRHRDHIWVLGAWVLPVAVAAARTAVRGGVLAITLPVALVVGILATVLHLRDRA